MKDFGPLPENHDYTKCGGVALKYLCDCKFCGKLTQKTEAHLHQNSWVCEDCWDERLKITE